MGGKIDPKSRKSVPGGTPKWRQEAKMIKRGVVLNSLALLGAIFEENGLQDGGQNRQKIDKKVVLKISIPSLNFEGMLKRFWYENGAKILSKMDPKIDKKSL